MEPNKPGCKLQHFLHKIAFAYEIFMSELVNVVKCYERNATRKKRFIILLLFYFRRLFFISAATNPYSSQSNAAIFSVHVSAE